MPVLNTRVNGKTVQKEIKPTTLLVAFLRDGMGLTGTHVGCDTSQCGACVVHVDGVAVKSCTMLALQAEGADIQTIEDLAGDDGTLHPVQQAFQKHHALQCGFCTPGMIMASVALLSANPRPSPAQIRHGLEGNICRCTGYQNIVNAVLDASGQLGG